jgi:hypothetical protein
MYPKGSFHRKRENYMSQDRYPCSRTLFRRRKVSSRNIWWKEKWEADENDDNITSSTEDEDAHIEVVVK